MHFSFFSAGKVLQTADAYNFVMSGLRLIINVHAVLSSESLGFVKTTANLNIVLFPVCGGGNSAMIFISYNLAF